MTVELVEQPVKANSVENAKNIRIRFFMGKSNLTGLRITPRLLANPVDSTGGESGPDALPVSAKRFPSRFYA
jgi:hypothetical protein